MSKRYTVLGLSMVLALALAVPALGGPTNPVATISASAKSVANKALKKAKTANSTANTANSTANSALAEAKKAQTTGSNAQTTANTAKTTADTAKTTADAAQTTANTAKTTADTAKTTADAAKAAAATAEANANNRIKESIEVAESTPSDNSTNKFTSVACPSGDPAMGGGFSVGGTAQQVTVASSEETLYGGGWFVAANAISGTPTWSITALAVCGTK